MSLRDTQALFWRAITWPTGVEEFLAQADAETRRRFEDTFGQTPAFPRVERVGVYAEAYFWRQHDVLRDGFPALAFALGEARFRNLVTDYLLACPSADPALRHLGDALVPLLAEHAYAQSMPWVVDVARLEQWRYRLLDGPDAPSLSTSALATIPLDRWPGLRFRLADSARSLRGRYDAHAVWEQARAADEPASPPAGGPEEEFHVLVWRRGHAVVHRPLALAEGRALKALVGGASFAEITEHAERDAGGRADPQQVVGWLSGWLAAGVIGAVIGA